MQKKVVVVRQYSGQFWQFSNRWLQIEIYRYFDRKYISKEEDIRKSVVTSRGLAFAFIGRMFTERRVCYKTDEVLAHRHYGNSEEQLHRPLVG